MGLKMPDEDDGFASKILLMRAGNKCRAQSWLKASLGDEVEDLNSTTLCETENTNDIFAELQASDEYSGLGVPNKQNGDDNITKRHVLIANDALRRKLLSKDAYQRYQQGSLNKLDASKPMPRVEKRRLDDDDDDGEEKGRSAVARPKMLKVADASDVGSGKPSPVLEGAVKPLPSKAKKRPSTYLDQLLAERGRKKKTKTKSEGG